MTKPNPLGPQSELDLRRKIADGSQDPEDYCNLADHLVTSGRLEEAVLLYEKALNLSLKNFQRTRVSMELGWLFYELGDREKAMTLAQDTVAYLSREAERPEVLFVRGMSQSLLAHCLLPTEADARAEAARSALKWIDRLIAEAPEFEGIVLAYTHAARLENLLGNSQRAVALCKKCLQKELNDVERLECLLDLADALRLEKRFTEAEQAVVEALRLVEADKGRLPQLYFTLGLIQRAASRPADARRTFEQVLVELKSHPYLHDDPDFLADVCWNLGQLYYELGEYEKAVETFQKVLACYTEDDPYRRDILTWLGQCYHAIGASAAAKDYYEQVLASRYASDAEKASVQKDLGKLYYEAGKYHEAVAAFDKGLSYYSDNDPERTNMVVWLGYCYQGIGSHVRALDCFKEVLASPHGSEADKTSARKALAWSLARLCFESGDYKEAAAAFEEVLVYRPKGDPDRPNALVWLGHCYLATRDYEKARGCYEEALASPYVSEADKASAQEALARVPKKMLH